MTTDLAKLRPSLRLGPIGLDELRGNPLGGVYHFRTKSNPQIRLTRLTGKDERFPERVERHLYWFDDWVGDRWMETGILDCEECELFYSRAPIVTFTKTPEPMRTPGDQPSGRLKSVTRRGGRGICPHCDGRLFKGDAVEQQCCRGIRRCPEHGVIWPGDEKPAPPTWAKPGHLFNAWDGSFRNGRPGHLGMFRVVEVRREGRWRCPNRTDGAQYMHGKAFRTWSMKPSMGGLDEDLLADSPWRECSCGHRNTGEAFDTFTADELALEGVPDADPDEFWAMLQKMGAVGEDGKCWRVEFEAV